MKKQDRIELLLTADPAYVPVAARGAEVFALKRGFVQKTAGLIAQGVEEAVLNALEMGYGGMEDEIIICMAATSMGIEVSVSSRGLPLNPEQLPQYKPEHNGPQYDAGGLSFFLVKQLMDKVSFAATPSGERRLNLVKHLPLLTAMPDRPVDRAAGKTVTDLDGPHQIRLAGPEDAEEISRLVLKAHGQVLFSEDIYYPARVEEMLRSGKMVSAVAVGNGEIFGHGALLPMDLTGGVEEMTYGFVNPAFRSRGAVSDIARVLIENARQRQVSALMIMAVTNHVLSQKAAARAGFSECALMVATSAASAKVGHGDSAASDVGRIANLVQVRYLDTASKPPRLYLPHRHSTIIRKIYQHLGKDLDAQPVPDAVPDLPAESGDVHSDSNLVEGWMVIWVNAFGKDIRARVDRLLGEAIAQQIPAIQLMLPLDALHTPLLTPEFEASGFFFAGVGPGEGAREYLILQYINLSNPGYNDIHVLEGMGKELKDYVIKCSSL